MNADPNNTYWGSFPKIVDHKTNKLLGCHYQHELHATAEAELTDAIARHTALNVPPNARNVFNAIRQHTGHGLDPMLWT